MVPGLCRCYDCAAEVSVAIRYLTERQGMASDDPDLLREAAELIKTIGAKTFRKGRSLMPPKFERSM